MARSNISSTPLLERVLSTGEDARADVIRVIILESHSLLRASMRQMMDRLPAIETVGDSNTPSNLLQIIKVQRPNVLLLGTSLSLQRCLECINAIRAYRPGIGIVALLANPSPETVLMLVRNGIHGLLSEDASERDLEYAIRAAAAGNSFNCRRIRELLAASAGTEDRATNCLTRQELCVLRLLMQGESNRGIARKLAVREKTVEAHLTHIYNKLKVDSRVGAILRAQELKLLEAGPAYPWLRVIGGSGSDVLRPARAH